MVEKVSTDPELVGRVVSRSDDDSTEEDEPPNSKDRRQLTKDLLLHPIGNTGEDASDGPKTTVSPTIWTAPPTAYAPSHQQNPKKT
jgi:hypothetical protein